MRGLTTKQQRVLEVIRGSMRSIGQPPTVREI
ncbi:MAG: repressor LexA, partial [Armatimonadetes bacterium]|nr:repressor LexA [Armatimonadota bacterium]